MQPSELAPLSKLVMPGLVPGIHVLAALGQERRGWPGQSPAMTKEGVILAVRARRAEAERIPPIQSAGRCNTRSLSSGAHSRDPLAIAPYGLQAGCGEQHDHTRLRWTTDFARRANQ